MIAYLSPYRTDKNIGKALNDAIEAAPDGWICLTDQDVLFLRPDTKAQIEEIAMSGKNDLYGCVTNRLGVPQQVIRAMFNSDSITEHIAAATEMHEKHYGECIPHTGPIAAMLMLFHKRTWEMVGGFREHTLFFDREFSMKIKRKGIMLGVYVLHLYRWGQKMPQFYTKHLRNEKIP